LLPPPWPHVARKKKLPHLLHPHLLQRLLLLRLPRKPLPAQRLPSPALLPLPLVQRMLPKAQQMPPRVPLTLLPQPSRSPDTARSPRIQKKTPPSGGFFCA